MVSIPTTLFGVLGFVVLAVVLFGILEGDTNPTSPLHIINDQNQKNMDAITAAAADKPTDWVGAITNVGAIIIFGFLLIIGYLFLPFTLFAEFLVAISIMPGELEIVGVYIGIALVAGIAIFIRRG